MMTAEGLVNHPDANQHSTRDELFKGSQIMNVRTHPLSDTTLNPASTINVILMLFAFTLLAGCGGGGGSGSTPSSSETPPTASAGADITATEGDSVQLNGSGSDAQGAVTFAWQQTSGPIVTLTNTMLATPSFTAPSVSEDQALVFTLTVTDEGGLNTSDSVTVTVQDSGSGGGGATNGYLFYRNPLSAVDPANPGAPSIIEPTANLSQDSILADIAFITTDYDGATKRSSNSRSYAVMYVHTDGHFYKVYSGNGGSLTPVQVSSESNADKTCDDSYFETARFNDLANPEASQYIYFYSGADNTCYTPDDVYKMVRLNMDAATAPIDIPSPVMVLMDSNTGAITGWLVMIGNALSRCDSDFANCYTITTTITGGAAAYANPVDYVVLNIDSKLHSYDVVSGTLSAPFHTVPSAVSYNFAIDHDGTYGYFSQDKTVYRYLLDGSAAPTEIYTETKTIVTISLAGDYLILQVGSAPYSLDEIKTVPKSGGVAESLVSASSNLVPLVLAFSDTYLYYNLRNYVTTANGLYTMVPVAAGIVSLDNVSHNQYADSAWVGVTSKRNFDYSTGSHLSQSNDKMILAQGFNLSNGVGGYSAATLSTVDAQSGVLETTLGEMPTTEGVDNINCFGYTPYALCNTGIALTPVPPVPSLPFQVDMFFIDTATANSLTRITNTPNEDESLVSY